MNPPDSTPTTAPETTVSGAVSVSRLDAILAGKEKAPLCQDVSLAGTRMLTRTDIYDAMGIPEALRTAPEVRIDITTPITRAMFAAVSTATEIGGE